MTNQRPDLNRASCMVTAQVGPIFRSNRGFANPVRTGVGDYSVDVVGGYAPDDVVIVSAQGAVPVSVAVDMAGFPTTMRVRTMDGRFATIGVPIEADFALLIQKA